MKEEVKEKKARKKDMKTFCARCGKHKDTGARLQTCGRCKSINYCSAKCQKDDWKTGHKEDCASFKQPPLAKTFDTADRHDVPWPVDPVLAQGSSDGIGVWMTPSPKTIGAILEQAYHPADDADDLPPLVFPPSFKRWADIRPDKVPNMKYTGPTLLCLQFMVQNRRKDGRVIFCDASQAVTGICDMPKEVLLPEHHQGSVMHSSTRDGSPTMTFHPWIDYNNQIRVAIREINGVEAPKGRFGPDYEYQRPTPPTGGPWGRVVDWNTGKVVLSPGDFAVFRIQYRVGDGTTWSNYPDIVMRIIVSVIFIHLLDVKSGIGGDEWLSNARQLAVNRSKNPESVHVIVNPEFEYIRQYYKVYFDEDEDAWVEKRFGKRAAATNDMWLKAGPEMLKATLNCLPPGGEQKFIQLVKAMDPNFRIEQMVREAKQS
ncbi:hypothetical protein DL96DRAFT_798805 [Flagelloscypha sp. PMI_526]|nr:hypothetical protein DL96DRAFT_798805 [Flagelloscypha sp. PMI_526]